MCGACSRSSTVRQPPGHDQALDNAHKHGRLDHPITGEARRRCARYRAERPPAPVTRASVTAPYDRHQEIGATGVDAIDTHVDQLLHWGAALLE